jgi:ATP-dependent Lon protease
LTFARLENVSLEAAAIYELIRGHTDEAGVAELSEKIESLFRMLKYRVVNGSVLLPLQVK